MHAWESIQNVLDYIEDNLAESHSPEELAKIAGLSPFYFQRLFKRLINRPVCEYIKMRRLARACESLEDKNRRIVDIALEYGFGSHEHFTKTFKDAFGITPKEYRDNPVRLNQVIKLDLLLGYTMIDENVPLITESMVLEISRKTIEVPELYIGISAPVLISDQIPLGEATGIDNPGMLWDEFHDQKKKIKGIAPDGIELGASTYGESDDGTFTYFAGASMAPNEAAEDDYKIFELPASEYIICSFEAENFEELVTSALGKSMNYLFTTWLPRHDLSAMPFSAEKYTSADPELCKMELWVIPVPVEKESR